MVAFVKKVIQTALKDILIPAIVHVLIQSIAFVVVI